jgi:signal transduction histidine kinase
MSLMTRSPLRLWLWAWALVCLLLVGCREAATTSTEPPLVRAQHWLMDPGSQATLADIQAAPHWQPMTDWKSWGYGPETIWVRLDLRASEAPTSMPWVVQVRPPYLDYVTLYDPANGLEQRSGDALPPHDHELATINLTFQIPAMTTTRSVYLKLQSISTRVMQVKVMPYGEAQQSNRQQEWFIGFIVVMSAVFAIWAMAQWLYTRDRVIGAFALKQFMAMSWGFLLLGFARVAVGPWFPEGRLSNIASTSFLWLIGTTLWFLALLISEYRPSRIALRACYGLAIFLAILPVLYWSGWPYLALSIGNICIPLAMTLLTLTLLSAWRHQVQKPIPLKYMLFYLCCYSLVNSTPPLMHLGWINADMIAVFGTLAHTVFDGIVMFFVMQIRARNMARERQNIALELNRSQEKAQAEARHREEQSQLFAMLAHEMKTPLATLRMWMDAGQLKPETMERAITDMNQVIERCVHTGQLADQGLAAIPQRVEPVTLTQQCIHSCRAPDQVDFDAPVGDHVIETDAQMLSIVLGNLLDNACKYGSPQGRIRVSLAPAEEQGLAGWRWLVNSQAGTVGLPDPSRLFEKYYRSGQARRMSGSGLGLFLVKGLLDLLEGTIRYEAREDHAIFSVWIPAALARR